MIPFLAVIIVASWVSAIAIVSVQNATPATLHFLVWRSITVPFGVMLAFSVTAGAIGMALLQGIWGWFAASEQGLSPDDPPNPIGDSIGDGDEFED
ncbi:DUF1049 domain-containing protein [Trichothermofontia sp.]